MTQSWHPPQPTQLAVQASSPLHPSLASTTSTSAFTTAGQSRQNATTGLVASRIARLQAYATGTASLSSVTSTTNTADLLDGRRSRIGTLPDIHSRTGYGRRRSSYFAQPASRTFVAEELRVVKEEGKVTADPQSQVVNTGKSGAPLVLKESDARKQVRKGDIQGASGLQKMPPDDEVNKMIQPRGLRGSQSTSVLSKRPPATMILPLSLRDTQAAQSSTASISAPFLAAEGRLRNVSDQASGQTTSSAGRRRQSVKELYELYGVQRPAGLVSGEDFGHDEDDTVPRAQHETDRADTVSRQDRDTARAQLGSVRIQMPDPTMPRGPRAMASQPVLSSAVARGDLVHLGRPDTSASHTRFQPVTRAHLEHHRNASDSDYDYDRPRNSRNVRHALPYDREPCDSPTCRATHAGHWPYRHSISCSQRRSPRPEEKSTRLKAEHAEKVARQHTRYRQERQLQPARHTHNYVESALQHHLRFRDVPPQIGRTGREISHESEAQSPLTKRRSFAFARRQSLDENDSLALKHGNHLASGIVGQCAHCLDDCQCDACCKAHGDLEDVDDLASAMKDTTMTTTTTPVPRPRQSTADKEMPASNPALVADKRPQDDSPRQNDSRPTCHVYAPIPQRTTPQWISDDKLAKSLAKSNLDPTNRTAKRKSLAKLEEKGLARHSTFRGLKWRLRKNSAARAQEQGRPGGAGRREGDWRDGLDLAASSMGSGSGALSSEKTVALQSSTQRLSAFFRKRSSQSQSLNTSQGQGQSQKASSDASSIRSVAMQGRHVGVWVGDMAREGDRESAKKIELERVPGGRAGQVPALEQTRPGHTRDVSDQDRIVGRAALVDDSNDDEALHSEAGRDETNATGGPDRDLATSSLTGLSIVVHRRGQPDLAVEVDLRTPQHVESGPLSLRRCL